MSDKIEIRVEESGEIDIFEILKEKLRERYPGYTLSWIATDDERNVIEEEIGRIFPQESKVVDIEVNILPVSHIGVLVPEGTT